MLPRSPGKNKCNLLVCFLFFIVSTGFVPPPLKSPGNPSNFAKYSAKGRDAKGGQVLEVCH